MVRVDGAEYCIDPAGGIADALGKKWTLPLIGILGNRSAQRFREIREGLGPIGAKSLSDRLRDLQNLGIVARKAYPEIPPRVEYRLTPKGEDLRRALVPLLEWASRESPEASDRTI
ncbi:MAG TPA: helix-turn-helix domain-containing protein [Thermoplasmata archaeon]|nr:helix-turn-helix domain-containing protein [Thermoplasmata archaeon]